MTPSQIEGLVRSAMLLASGYVLSWGLDGSTWMTITAGVAGIAGALWSWKSNSTATMADRVATDPEVNKVVMETEALADSIPNDKVVSK
jgi:hypothetical protein